MSSRETGGVLFGTELRVTPLEMFANGGQGASSEISRGRVAHSGKKA